MSRSLMDNLASIRTDISLTETEDSWEKICRGIVSFSEFIRASSTNGTHEIITKARELHRPIINAMKSERTRLSGPAIDLISTLASELGTDFEPLLHLFFPTLLLLCARTSKVVVGRARSCILCIIETTQLVTVIPYFIQAIRDKSVSLRTVAAESTLACLNSLNPPDLEKEERTKDIEAFIKMSVRDANAEVRKIGKQIYQAYELLLPNKAESFIAPLTPTSKKYLGLSSRPKSAIELGGVSGPPPQVSSSSSSRVPDSKPQAPKLVKKASQASLPSSVSSRTQPGPHVQRGIANSTSRSRPHSAMDLHAGPTREDTHLAHLSQNNPVRPNLPLSRSESAATSNGHFRSTSTTLLAHNASCKPTNVSAAPQRVLVAPVPNVPAPSFKSTSGPVRVDPRAVRDHNPPGSKKPALSSDESDVTAKKPDVKSVRDKVESKKTELPKLVSESKEEPRKEGSNSLLNKRSLRSLNKIQQPPNGKNGQNPRDALKTSTSSVTTASTSKIPSVSSQTKNAPHYTQPVASSRARTVSASTSASVAARAPFPRTRTISSSASTSSLDVSAKTRPPAVRARTASSTAASTSAAIVAVARSRETTTSNSIDANSSRSATSSKTLSKPVWGSSSGTRSVVPVPGKRVARTDVPKPSITGGKRSGKQKRPSVVPEELDEVATPHDDEDEVVAPHDDENDVKSADTSITEGEGVEETASVDKVIVQTNELDAESLEGEDKSSEFSLNTRTGARELESPLIDFSVMREGESTTQSALVTPENEGVGSAALVTHVTNQTPGLTQAGAPNQDMTTSPLPVKVTVTPSSSSLLETPVRVHDLTTPMGVQATPISALLSSIQRGFLFTPATPLSPPDSYLPKEVGGLPTIPFPLFSNINTRTKEDVEREHSSLDWKGRQALETMDMN